MRIALCQLNVTDHKTDNLHRAKRMLHDAAQRGATLAILPEMFSIAYRPELFRGAAEPCPGGESFHMLEQTARETGMTIVGGSIPELEGNSVYNTSLVFEGAGGFAGKYRKAHLFDIDVPGVFRFMESQTITKGGGHPLIAEKPLRFGVMICFDIRFPEWSRLAMQKGCDLIALPAAFSLATGPRHWELLMRARALDNQLFVAAVSPARSKSAYGHSMLVSPDGNVLYDCGEDEQMKVLELDLSLLDEMRGSIPVRQARRLDLYELNEKLPHGG